MVTVIGTSGGAVSDPEARWLTDAVDEWRVASEKPRFDPGWFHCSALGYSDEQLVAQYRGILELQPHTARELRVFDNGHDRDGSIKRYMKEAKLSVVAEEGARSVSMPYLKLRGTLDDIVHNPETGQWFVLENKTMNPFQFHQLQAPMPAHRMQIMSYMAMTNIEEGIVLYENKGDQSWRAFYVPFDKPLWSSIVKRLLRLRAEAERLDSTMDPKIVDLSLRLNAALSE